MCGVSVKIACRAGRQKRELAVESGVDRVVEQSMGLQEKVQTTHLRRSKRSLPMLVYSWNPARHVVSGVQ